MQKRFGLFKKSKTFFTIKYLLWFSLVFISTQFVVYLLFSGLLQAGMLQLSNNMLNIVYGVTTYLVMLIVVVGLPWWFFKSKTSRQELGLTRSLRWSDMGWSLLGVVAYVAMLMGLFWLAQQLIPGFNLEQEQELGIISPSRGIEMMTAFLLLVVLGPIIEEVLFRGCLYGKLKSRGVPVVIVILLVSLLFGIAHVQPNVAIDTFALSIVMCLAREFTGSIWVGILMHMIKNGLAFYVGFVMS